MIHSLSKMDKTNTLTYKTITNAQSATSAISVAETDRGGMAMSYAFVKHNRVYKGNQAFSIPWSNKDLNISYETFRDKLLPGANEEMESKITGNKGESCCRKCWPCMMQVLTSLKHTTGTSQIYGRDCITPFTGI
ncbi:MAG: hypothetical protein IPI88_16660 [Chitinophagaceae bacterium]|nr:hypothetical protein [Chitinophagaceae bacterium]